MHLEGVKEIKASRQKVWESISDPQRMAESNSQGGAKVEKIDDRHYRVTATAPGMPMAVVLNLELTEMDPPSRLGAHLNAAIMGSPVDGTGTIELDELGPELTRARYQADATLGGMLSAFEPMIAGPLQQGVDQGMDSLKTRIESGETGPGN